MKNSSGAVLIMVLILSAIMFLIATTLLLITMTEVHISDFEQRSTQAFYAAESSATLGLAKLRTNTDYRTDTSDTISIGGNTGLLNVRFYDGTKDGNGHYRKSLSPSLYRLVLQGQGSVPGLNAAARRTIERDVVVKPFLLFARNTVTLSGGCQIKGNIHGNSSVIIDKLSTVKGDVTSSGPVIIGDKIFNDTIKEINDGTVDGTVSSLEPKITLPPLPIALYSPKYRYKGDEYEAKPLIHDTVILSPVDGVDPPVPSIDIYSGFPTSKNPAGIFFPKSEITGSFIVLDVIGTVVDPSTTGTLSINGTVRIMPVPTEDFEHFPALVSARNLGITFTSVEELKPFLKSIKKSQIEGLIYAQGDVSFTGNDATGKIIKGSIFGQKITIIGNPVFQVTYDPAIISDPPPGIDLIEIGEWREIIK